MKPACSRVGVVRRAVSRHLLLVGLAGIAAARDGRADVLASPTGELSLEPTMIDFGDVDHGASATHAVKVENTAHGRHAELRVMGVEQPDTAGCAAFELEAPSAFPITMTAGEDATWRVTLRGDAVGRHRCTIDLVDDDGRSDAIDLSATIVAPSLTVQPEKLDFGDVVVGDASEHRVLITNGSGAAIALSAVSAGGSAEFALSGLRAPATVEPRTTRVLTVTYRPVAGGRDVGTVQIVQPGGIVSIPLVGAGADEGEIVPPGVPGADAGAGAGAAAVDPGSYYTCSSSAPADAGSAAAALGVALVLLRRRRDRLGGRRSHGQPLPGELAGSGRAGRPGRPRRDVTRGWLRLERVDAEGADGVVAGALDACPGGGRQGGGHPQRGGGGGGAQVRGEQAGQAGVGLAESVERVAQQEGQALGIIGGWQRHARGPLLAGRSDGVIAVDHVEIRGQESSCHRRPLWCDGCGLPDDLQLGLLPLMSRKRALEARLSFRTVRSADMGSRCPALLPRGSDSRERGAARYSDDGATDCGAGRSRRFSSGPAGSARPCRRAMRFA